MLSRLILAAASIAALTAFMRFDAEATGSATPAASPATAAAAVRTSATDATASPLLSAASASAPAATASGRPVRVILPPLYGTANATGPVAASSFVPTPGSPVGPRGAGFARAATPSPKPALAARSTDGAVASRRVARAERAPVRRQQTLPPAVLGGVQPAALVLR